MAVVVSSRVDPAVCLGDPRGHRIAFRDVTPPDLDGYRIVCRCTRCHLIFLPGMTVTGASMARGPGLRFYRECLAKLGRESRFLPPSPPEAYDRMFD